MILLPRNNRGHNKGKGCPPCGRSRRSHLFNISVVLVLVFACNLPTTQAVSDSTNHLLKGHATRNLSRTITSEDDSPPGAFTVTSAAAGDASSSGSSTTFGFNGLLSGGEDQQQHLDADFPAPLIQADSLVNVQGKDNISNKVRHHYHE